MCSRRFKKYFISNAYYILNETNSKKSMILDVNHVLVEV